MPSVADAIRLHGPSAMRSLSSIQQKALSLISRCRTGALGGVLYRCEGCGSEHWTGRSCGNRHCTSCGHEKTQAWIEKQRKRLMPVHHFLVTFTVPRELALVLRASQREGYRCLFDASSQSIQDVGSATKSLRGCQLGFFGVLHTWGRDPQTYHPHIHFVVPGGGVKRDQHGQAVAWQATPKNFLFHQKTLRRVYKAKLADELRAAGLYRFVPASAWNKPLVVDIKPVGHGVPTLKYLAPYVHRVAISDRRIVSVDSESVSYTVRPSTSRRELLRKVDGETFVRSFSQHILPSGFQKIRHYGWMSPNSRIKLEEVKWLVWLYLGWTFWLGSAHAPQEKTPKPILRCRLCGDRVRRVAVSTDVVSIDPNRSLAYFDSG